MADKGLEHMSFVDFMTIFFWVFTGICVLNFIYYGILNPEDEDEDDE